MLNDRGMDILWIIINNYLCTTFQYNPGVCLIFLNKLNNSCYFQVIDPDFGAIRPGANNDFHTLKITKNNPPQSFFLIQRIIFQ